MLQYLTVITAARPSCKVVAGLVLDNEDETILPLQSYKPSSIHILLKVNGKQMQFQVDISAAVDVISAIDMPTYSEYTTVHSGL